MTLGKRIAAGRKRLGMTQEQLAEQLGITAQAVSKWENDQSCPDITMLPRLADLFGTTTDALLGRTPVHQAEPNEEHVMVPDQVFQRKPALGFAVFVLLAGSLLLTARLLDWEVSFWGILWPSALMVFGFGTFFGRFSVIRLGCGVFGGYFLLEELGIVELDGDLILPVILLIFGVGVLLDALRRPAVRKRAGRRSGSGNGFGIDGESFWFTNSFGEDAQYISMPRLSSGVVKASFGETRLDLGGVESLAEGCTIEASCSFGELTILVPGRFRVQCDGDTSFASIQVTGQPDQAPTGTISLSADCSFGSIEVRYQ